MDLLSQRYANPYLVLDDFIRLQQLHDFSIETLKTIAEEKKQKSRWEYYLHRVWDMSFEEYVALCDRQMPREEKMTQEEVESVINTSKSMLDGFSPI